MTRNRASAQSHYNYVSLMTLPGYINSDLRVAISHYLHAILLVLYVPDWRKHKGCKGCKGFGLYTIGQKTLARVWGFEGAFNPSTVERYGLEFKK